MNNIQEEMLRTSVAHCLGSYYVKMSVKKFDELIEVIKEAVSDMFSLGELHYDLKVESDLFDETNFDGAARSAAMEVAGLVIGKQHDYGKGNILQSPIKPELAIAVRLNDKVARLANLAQNNNNPQNESLIDTADDIIGYGLILKMVLNGTFKLPMKEMS